jgi:hypothetical protein
LFALVAAKITEEILNRNGKVSGNVLREKMRREFVEKEFFYSLNVELTGSALLRSPG